MLDENNENIVSNFCSALQQPSAPLVEASPKISLFFFSHFSLRPSLLSSSACIRHMLHFYAASYVGQHHVYFAPIKSIAAKRQLILRQSYRNSQCVKSVIWHEFSFFPSPTKIDSSSFAEIFPIHLVNKIP